MCKEPNNSALPAVDVGSKVGEGMVGDFEHGLVGIPMTAGNFGDLIESVEIVQKNQGIAERREHRTVVSSVQQTEDFVGTGTLPMK